MRANLGASMLEREHVELAVRVGHAELFERPLNAVGAVVRSAKKLDAHAARDAAQYASDETVPVVRWLSWNRTGQLEVSVLRGDARTT